MDERFEGIILFKRDYREKDALVKIFTKEFGAKMFFIKNFNQANHPLRRHCIPITQQYFLGKINESGLSFLKEGQTLQLFRSIQEDHEKLAYATYFIQLVDAALEDNVANLNVYTILSQCLSLLNQGLDSQVLMVCLEMKLLPYLGIHLNWQSCALTGRQDGPFDFSLKFQGILSQAVWEQDDFRLHISPKTIHVAIILANCQLEQIQSINLGQKTKEELSRLMDTIYQEFVGLRLKGKSYLKQLKQLDEQVQAISNVRKRSNESGPVIDF
ncbi:DNA repair protein RecO [Vaginisenegalia massiliensis]|uniref:DNA repair protein RecO n=1 Tax=Vaginisenegalia massiliensis TaxID=2058294 RepID=UPI000F53CCA9|nr:DNA repair protein RecO [Vaginisenegalia massiliensis]